MTTIPRFFRACAAAMLIAITITSLAHAQQQRPSLEQILNSDGTLRPGARLDASFDARGWQVRRGPDGRPRFIRSDTEPRPFNAGSAAVPDDQYWDDRLDEAIDRIDISTVAVIGSDLYIGGDFVLIDDLEVNNIARWDGTRWHALGNGVNGSVELITASGGELYVAGYFSRAGSDLVSGIARWDGTKWSAMGQGDFRGVFGSIDAILPHGDDVYVAGGFDYLGDDPSTWITANNIAVWHRSSNTWSPLMSNGVAGVAGSVRAMAARGESIYLVGSFDSVGDMAANNAAIWRPRLSSWSLLGTPEANGIQGYASGIVADGGSVYVSGSFDTVAGTLPANNIARWDSASNTWGTLGSGADNGRDGFVVDMLLAPDGLYVTGSFEHVGSVDIWSIDRWDGTAWSTIGKPPHPPRDLVLVNGKIHFSATKVDSGLFTPALFRASGDGWEEIEGSPRGGGGIWITAIATHGDDVYIGGSFYMVGAQRADNLVRWNSASNTWHVLGTKSTNGVDGSVNALLVQGDRLYVGGWFSRAGDATANSIAYWDIASSTWHSLGEGIDNGISGYVNAIVPSKGRLYVGGQFDTAGSISAKGLAIWDPSTRLWSSPGLVESDPLITDLRTDLLAVQDDLIYAYGYVSLVVGAGNGIVEISGSDYGILANSISGDVYTMAVHEGLLYVGGFFSDIDGVELNNLAKWDGSGWSSVGGGTNGGVRGLASYGSKLYAGGLFDTVGGVAARGIAMWENGVWSPLGSGVNDHVNRLAVDSKGNLIAGGNFVLAGGKPSVHVARWTKGAVSAIRGSADALGLELESHPNPLSNSAMLDITLPRAGSLELSVVNALGVEVVRVVEGYREAGSHRVELDASGLPAGVYYCRLRSGEMVRTIQVSVVR